jgi:hypothetical protein
MPPRVSTEPQIDEAVATVDIAVGELADAYAKSRA